MVRACICAARGLRPNNSLAGVFGSSGLARGGSGFGSTLPLSCAFAAPLPASPMAKARNAICALRFRCGRCASIVIVMVRHPLEGLSAAPARVYARAFRCRMKMSKPWPVHRKVGAVERDPLEEVGHLAPAQCGGEPARRGLRIDVAF